MVVTNAHSSERTDIQAGVKITRFGIKGLFGRLDHEILFPSAPSRDTEPEILILAGRNGSGKTMILNMLNGMLKLDFNLFRRIPFQSAELSFSDNETMIVTKLEDEAFPLKVSFKGTEAILSKTKQNYTHEQAISIEKFREGAKQTLGSINYELLDIHRSSALRAGKDEKVDVRDPVTNIVYGTTTTHYTTRRARADTREENDSENLLALRVFKFIREAQVDYRKYFAAEQLELLPRILERLSAAKRPPRSVESLRNKIAEIEARVPLMKRLGLEADEADLKSLRELLAPSATYNEEASSIAVLDAYVETQERRNETKELIAKRLVEFEKIMDDFLIGKSVRIDSARGLKVEDNGKLLNESDLSSGEYHFLYMMVSALLCYRVGSIIAIDEPELSLHVNWQRKVVAALAKCASGASPFFLFATHSAAISAEHRDRVVTLASEE